MPPHKCGGIFYFTYLTRPYRHTGGLKTLSVLDMVVQVSYLLSILVQVIGNPIIIAISQFVFGKDTVPIVIGVQIIWNPILIRIIIKQVPIPIQIFKNRT